jgi:hypothetical protein
LFVYGAAKTQQVKPVPSLTDNCDRLAVTTEEEDFQVWLEKIEIGLFPMR